MRYIARVSKKVALNLNEARENSGRSIRTTSPFPIHYFTIIDGEVVKEVGDCVFEECADEFYKSITKDLKSLCGRYFSSFTVHEGYRIFMKNEKLLMESSMRGYRESYFLVIHHGNDEHTVYLECEEGSEPPELALQYSDAEVKEVYMDIK